MASSRPRRLPTDSTQLAPPLLHLARGRQLGFCTSTDFLFSSFPAMILRILPHERLVAFACESAAHCCWLSPCSRLSQSQRDAWPPSCQVQIYRLFQLSSGFPDQLL